MKGVALVTFFPQEILPILVLSIAFAVMVGARRLARALMVLVLVSVFLPLFLEPIFNEVPVWALILVGGLIVLRLFREVVALILGGGAADTMIGTLAAGFVKVLLFFPRSIFRFLSGNFFGPR